MSPMADERVLRCSGTMGTGRPWRNPASLLAAAQGMFAVGELYAESAHEEPRMQQAWLSLGGRSTDGPAAAVSSGAARSLEKHMLENITGVGPSMFKVCLLLCRTHT